jgi:hypothetical protein
VWTTNQLLFELPVFFSGIGHESPLQQHDPPWWSLQQAWAFLPFFLALQQDMSLFPSLQQPAMSQQASVFWLLFWGEFRFRAAAETDRAAAQAKLINSIFTFLILVCS